MRRGLAAVLIVLSATSISHLMADSPESTIKNSLESAMAQLGKTRTKSSMLGIQGADICDIQPEAGLDLEQRIAWNDRVADCAGALAKALRQEATRAPVDQILELQLSAGSFEAIEKSAREESEERSSEKKFLGLEWGLGFGASYSFDQLITDATVVNGIVHATKEETIEPRAVLEFHAFLFGHDNGVSGAKIKHGNGPFAVVAAKTDEILGGFGLGWMWGWKDNDAPTDSNAFTIGIGVLLDGNVKALADGFEDDEPLPAGETEIRFKEETRASALVLVTRTF